MRAIDLYSGVGGWSCGLQMSGIEVVKSYEIDKDAIATNRLNSDHECVRCDILELNLEDLPTDIDFVVGSPPCTQFSFSNRGGQGDLDNGLKHIAKFLEVVSYLRPRWWVMENVPRTIGIVQACFAEGGIFSEFSHLQPEYFIAKAERFGTPQRRRRALIGNIDFDALTQSESDQPIPLRKVIDEISSAKDTIIDPVYGTAVPRSHVSDLAIEEALDPEENRINRLLKTSHHIYNKMSFPENEEFPSRTLTATCTRVSRESIVVRDRRDSKVVRRLSVRERASVQGFPILYEFAAKSYAGKIKQIGNAIPPTLSLAIGCTLSGLDRLVVLKTAHATSSITHRKRDRPTEYTFERKRVFSKNRNYRFSLDEYNFGSGVRFELTNNATLRPAPSWECKFWYGTSKRILELPLDRRLLEYINELFDLENHKSIVALQDTLSKIDDAALQTVWSHRGPAGLHPFQLADILTEKGLELYAAIKSKTNLPTDILSAIIRTFGPDPEYIVSSDGKLAANTNRLLSGFYICCQFNARIKPAINGSTSEWITAAQ